MNTLIQVINDHNRVPLFKISKLFYSYRVGLSYLISFKDVLYQVQFLIGINKACFVIMILNVEMERFSEQSVLLTPYEKERMNKTPVQ